MRHVAALPWLGSCVYVGTLPWCGCTDDVFPTGASPACQARVLGQKQPSTAKSPKQESPRALPVLPPQTHELACSLAAPVQKGAFPQWFVFPQDTGRSL